MAQRHTGHAPTALEVRDHDERSVRLSPRMSAVDLDPATAPMCHNFEMEKVSLRTQAKWGFGTLLAWTILSILGLGNAVLVVAALAAVWGMWDVGKRHVLQGHGNRTNATP